MPGPGKQVLFSQLQLQRAGFGCSGLLRCAEGTSSCKLLSHYSSHNIPGPVAALPLLLLRSCLPPLPPSADNTTTRPPAAAKPAAALTSSCGRSFKPSSICVSLLELLLFAAFVMLLLPVLLTAGAWLAYTAAGAAGVAAAVVVCGASSSLVSMSSESGLGLMGSN